MYSHKLLGMFLNVSSEHVCVLGIAEPHCHQNGTRDSSKSGRSSEEGTRGTLWKDVVYLEKNKQTWTANVNIRVPGKPPPSDFESSFKSGNVYQDLKAKVSFEKVEGG